MKILITTPFFNNLGGSELETIHTANAISVFDKVTKIDLYVESDFDPSFCKNIYISPKINFIKYSSLFTCKVVRFADKKIKKSLNLDINPFRSFYWILKRINKYDRIYIITKSTQDYYIPIIRLFRKKRNIVVKFTTIFYEEMSDYKLSALTSVRNNIVTSQVQTDFFKNRLNLKNTISQEVILYKENEALKRKRALLNRELFDFGFLGRLSEEKQIEDCIMLIKVLKERGFVKTLLIRGKGDTLYCHYLLNIVEENKLSDQVFVEFESVAYDEVFDFFDRINCFLITSKYEGGPNVGLEVMAYGIPVLTYKVGAMQDRLKDFSELLANDFIELVEKAIEMLCLEDFEYVEKCQKIKRNYIENYANKYQVEYLKDFING